MHELALMESVAELALAEGRQRGAEAITAIHLRIGSLAGVEPEALRFAAQVVLRGGLVEGARFTVEVVPARAWCTPCGALFGLEAALGLCPRCGAASADLREGRELELASLELRLPDDATGQADASEDAGAPGDAVATNGEVDGARNDDTAGDADGDAEGDADGDAEGATKGATSHAGVPAYGTAEAP